MIVGAIIVLQKFSYCELIGEMKLINRKFKQYWRLILSQWALATCLVLLVLFCLGRLLMTDILSAIGVSSIAASAFIIFTLPDSPVAATRRVIGSYLFAMMIGVVINWVVRWIPQVYPGDSLLLLHQLGGATAVALTMLAMIVFDYEHPPAAGFSLGLVLDQWNHWTLLVVFVAVIAFTTCSKLLHKRMVSVVGGDET